MGNGQIRQLPYTSYESYASLKKYIGSSLDRKYRNMYLHRFTYNMNGTASEVEFEEAGGVTIADIAKTPITMVGAMSANDNDYDGAIATLVYKSNDGIEHTATCVINTTDSTTEVAFKVGSTSVIDFYTPISLVLSVAVKAGHTFGCGATGALTNGVIQATKTIADEEDLVGVGSVYSRYSTNNASYIETIQYYSYVTAWGEVKFAYSEQDSTDATTEVKLYEVTIDTSGFTSSDYYIENFIKHGVGSNIPVRDFYRRQYMNTEVTPSSGHNLVICNADMSAIYGIVEEGNYESYHSRFMAPIGSDTWIAHITAAQSIITHVVCNISIYYTPRGETHQHKVILPIANNTISQIDPIIPIEPGSDVKFTILGNLSNMTLDVHILEAVKFP